MTAAESFHIIIIAKTEVASIDSVMRRGLRLVHVRLHLGGDDELSFAGTERPSSSVPEKTNGVEVQPAVSFLSAQLQD